MPGRARVLEAPARRGWASQPSPQHSLSSQPSCAPQAFALCRPGQSLRFRRQEDPAPGQGSLVLSDAAKLSSVGFTAPTRMSHPNTHTTQKRSQAEVLYLAPQCTRGRRTGSLPASQQPQLPTPTEQPQRLLPGGSGPGLTGSSSTPRGAAPVRLLHPWEPTLVPAPQPGEDPSPL